MAAEVKAERNAPLPLGEWTPWSPREEIAPRFTREAADEGTCLKIDGRGDPAAYGAWQARAEGIVGGRTYRFAARYRAENVARPLQCVSAYLDWRDERDRRAAPPDFIPEAGGEDGGVRIEHVAPAPENARSVFVRLGFGGCAEGSVTWDRVRLEEAPAPPERIVRVATVFHRPRGTRSPEESVASFCRVIETAGLDWPDVICLPEGITAVGNGLSYAEVAEPVPGPTTETLGALAKRRNAYMVAGVYERVGHVVYNTAVLIGRDGAVKGAYRKTHLPREEVEAGLTPGGAYPVFETDFGRVGLMICWDVQFPEPARALALRGAEILFLPIWGGSEVLARARAIENHAFLVSSSYDMATFIVDPAGAVLAEATEENPVAVADLNLDRKIVQPWLGDMKARTWKERRADLPVESPPCFNDEK